MTTIDSNFQTVLSWYINYPSVHLYNCHTGLGSSTVDQVLKYIKYPKYIPSTSTGQVLIFLKSTYVHQVLSYQVQVQVQVLILKLVTLY